MVHASIPGIALVIAGILGALGVDARIAWACVAIAGLFLLVG
jgi:hypothetical protein